MALKSIFNAIKYFTSRWIIVYFFNHCYQIKKSLLISRNPIGPINSWILQEVSNKLLLYKQSE